MLAELKEKVDSEAALSPDAPAGDELTTSPAIRIERVVPQAIGAVWPRVKRMVRDAVRWSPFTRKLQTINDVERRLLHGDYSLWVVFDGPEIVGAALTLIVQETQCRVLEVAYGAGERVRDWAQEFYELMDDEATEQDCRFIRIEGRKGWLDILQPLGFKEAYRAYMIEV